MFGRLMALAALASVLAACTGTHTAPPEAGQPAVAAFSFNTVLSIPYALERAVPLVASSK